MENKRVVDLIKSLHSGNRIFIKMAKRFGARSIAQEIFSATDIAMFHDGRFVFPSFGGLSVGESSGVNLALSMAFGQSGFNFNYQNLFDVIPLDVTNKELSALKSHSDDYRQFQEIILKPDAILPALEYEEVGVPCYFVTKARIFDDIINERKSSYTQAKWVGCSGNIYKGIRVYDKNGKPYYLVKPEGLAHKKQVSMSLAHRSEWKGTFSFEGRKTSNSLDDGYGHYSSKFETFWEYQNKVSVYCIPVEHVYDEVGAAIYADPNLMLDETTKTKGKLVKLAKNAEVMFQRLKDYRAKIKEINEAIDKEREVIAQEFNDLH